MDLLPPGCQFYPSEELLLNYYLNNKNINEVGNYDGANLIKELDLYSHDPFELPDTACFSYGYQGRERHWYCFTGRVAEENKMGRSGLWIKKGRACNIFGGVGNAILGTRTRLVFFIGNIETNWTLDEYALANNPLAPFILCRVFDSSAGPQGIQQEGHFGPPDGALFADVEPMTRGELAMSILMGDYIELNDLA